jgi:hypothetical protein
MAHTCRNIPFKTATPSVGNSAVLKKEYKISPLRPVRSKHSTQQPVLKLLQSACTFLPGGFLHTEDPLLTQLLGNISYTPGDGHVGRNM